MARLSKESEQKIDIIIRIANAQVYAALGKLNELAKQLSTSINKSAQKNPKLRKLTSEVNEILLKTSNLYNQIYNSGAKGLEIHSKLQDIENSCNNLKSLIVTNNIVEPILLQYIAVIKTIKQMVAKTGFIEAMNPAEKLQEVKKEIPRILQIVISKLTNVIDNENISIDIRNKAKEYLGIILKAIKEGGEGYERLVANNYEEALKMLSSVFEE